MDEKQDAIEREWPYTTAQVARLSGVSVHTLRRKYFSKYEIPHVVDTYGWRRFNDESVVILREIKRRNMRRWLDSDWENR